MYLFKIFFLITCLIFVLNTSFQASVSAASIFGYSDPAGCESKDPVFPSLMVCGRNPVSAGECKAYTKQCDFGDLVETGSRALVWLLLFTLLLVPIFVMYYGAMIMWNQKWDGGVSAIKKARDGLKKTIIYFILMLAAWLIVRTIVDVFQVREDVPTFLIDEKGEVVKARNFDASR